LQYVKEILELWSILFSDKIQYNERQHEAGLEVSRI